MSIRRRIFIALGVVAGGFAALALVVFVFIGGLGIVYGLAWIAWHPKLEWLEGGADRAQLREIALPAKPPGPEPPTWEWYRPDSAGASQGGASVLITPRPGRHEWVGVHSGGSPGTPLPHRGLVLDAERRRVAEFSLEGGSAPGAMAVVMPTPDALLVVGIERRPDGRYLRSLDEYDFDRKTRVRRITDDLFRVWFTRLDDTAAVVVYGTGELPMGMNMQRPRYSTVRLYSPKAPCGADLFRMSYGIGSVQALWSERPGEAIFVTRFDHGLKVRHPEDRAWTLTLR
jgi:hypothetical protein